MISTCASSECPGSGQREEKDYAATCLTYGDWHCSLERAGATMLQYLSQAPILTDFDLGRILIPPPSPFLSLLYTGSQG